MASSVPLQIPSIPHSKSTKTREKFLKLHKNETDTSQTLYKSYFQKISLLCKESRIQEAVAIITEMDYKDIHIGPEIFGEILQGCIHRKAIFTGQQVHARILKKGDLFSRNEYIETKLVIVYAKCDASEVALKLFRRLKKQNIFSWATMIGVCCKIGSNEEALNGFCEMHRNGHFPDNFVVPNALKACSALQMIDFGKGIHGYALKMGYCGSCVYVDSSLVDMYGKCGLLVEARKTFDNIEEKNVVAWNSMIVGYVQNRMNQEALEVFYDMRVEGVEPTRVTLSNFLSASANLEALEEGRQGHAVAILYGLEMDNIMGSSLINLYSKTGEILDAEVIFIEIKEKDTVSWNLLISGYVQGGLVEEALDTCRRMRSKNLRYDSVTLASILCVSGNSKNLKLGKEGQGYCIRHNLDSDVAVASNTVVMYTKCGRMDDARRVFDIKKQTDVVLWNALISAYAKSGLSNEALKLFCQMKFEGVLPNIASWNFVILGLMRNGQAVEAQEMFSNMQYLGVEPSLITWTILISGLAQNNLGNEAIMLFKQMQENGLRPNKRTFAAVLSACTDIASLLYGRAVHGHITRRGLFSCSYVTTSVLDMYAKCGNMDCAKEVFNMVFTKELPLYNAMISCYAWHGDSMEAFVLFKQMQEEGIKPDAITFTSILSASTNGGLVDEGLKVFSDMVSVYSIKPSMEHYCCLVNLLSRCGNLDEALEVILAMPFNPDANILASLLAACSEHNEIELAERLAEYLFKLEPDNAGNYVTLSNNYGTSEKWGEVSKLRGIMKERGLKKGPGCSWIQIGAELHAFLAGKVCDPETEVIYDLLSCLEREMRDTSSDH